MVNGSLSSIAIQGGIDIGIGKSPGDPVICAHNNGRSAR
ncbi:hypothetical protein KT99_04797 [Shewanella benthica KT99]|uniref:Uncharacterized protein n=1 Tax=Shewanella benthica KT99 TaxID=314608 RepID=A9DD83_9GAMM|nr:hypothetical protein KT99_04797 [Shewanella benthica KT99]